MIGWRRTATIRTLVRAAGRLIQEKIKQPLSEELLFGKLSKGGNVTIDEKDGELTFLFESAPPKWKSEIRIRKTRRKRRNRQSNQPSAVRLPAV